MSIALKFREYEKLGESRGIKIGKVIGGEIGALATKVSGVRNNREESTDEQIIKFLRIDKKWFKTTLIDIVVI